MSPYTLVKILQLREEHLARHTTSCAPRGLLPARRGLRRLIDVISGPACVAHG